MTSMMAGLCCKNIGHDDDDFDQDDGGIPHENGGEQGRENSQTDGDEGKEGDGGDDGHVLQEHQPRRLLPE
jgi:hypothetical protein